MNTLLGYNSSDDSESEESEARLEGIETSRKISLVSVNSNNVDVKSKKNEDYSRIQKRNRKLDINILPSSIQQALRSGSSVYDSNADEDLRSEKKISFYKHETNQLHETKNSSNRQGLVGPTALKMRLPKPQNKEVTSATDFKPNVLMANRTKSITEKQSKTAELSTNPSENLVSNVIEVAKISLPIKLVQPHSSNDQNIGMPNEKRIAVNNEIDGAFSVKIHFANDEDDEEDDDEVLNESDGKLKEGLIAVNDPQSNSMSDYGVEESTSCYREDSQTASHRVDAGSFSSHDQYPHINYDFNPYNSYPTSISYNTSAQHDYSDGYQESKSKKRRKDRELEQALLSGNTVALDTFTGNIAIQEVAGDNQWDSKKYEVDMKTKREAQLINSTFHSNGVIIPPTKLQNRRHQINSLAASAAKMELALLEARGSRMKTKAETQAKYGW
jgi:hypothetical protein